MADSSFMQVEGLTKSFGAKVLFSDVSFGISQGDRVAIVARNGAGKTTLLNIIAGTEPYDCGSVSFKRDLVVGFLPQNPEFPAGTTVLQACLKSNGPHLQAVARYEQALLNPDNDAELSASMAQMDALKVWDYESRIKQILGKLNIHNLDQKVDNLSGGQLKRIALANVLITEPELLILDEPTNHLDLAMVEWLEDFLRSSHMALLMVTHDRYFLDRVCQTILEIDNQAMYEYHGNYSYYLEKHDERQERFDAEMSRANNLYRRELEWMRRQPQARGTKAQYRIDSFNELEKKVKQQNNSADVRLDVKAGYIGSKIFECKYISKSFGDIHILRDFYYNFGRYEKMGIVGNNGTGKSTFVKMIVGEETPDTGTIDIGETVRFGYFSQSGMLFDEGAKVIDTVQNIADSVDLGDGRRLNVSQFLQHFLFTPERQHDFVAKLSGGERRRLYLCTVLMQNPNFLVLDEPTNDLDIVTLNVLEDYLRNFKGCVMVVSHDRFFMDKVVDHLLVFHGDAKVQDFPGNYTDYRCYREAHRQDEKNGRNEKSDARKPQKGASASSQPSAPVRPEKKERPRKMTFREKQEYEALTAEIEALEAEQAQISDLLSSGSLQGDELVRQSQRIGEVAAQIEDKTERWLFLSDIAG